jgi:PAS domain S-box-containing protein
MRSFVKGEEKRILIVEDESIVAMALQKTLQAFGYTVVGTAIKGTDAIRLAKQTWPDLILMDIRIQGPIDGIETADRINAFYDIPVIFLTAYSDDETLSRAIATRGYAFLTKPFNERELYSNIEMVINKHRTYKKALIQEKIVHSAFYLVSDAIFTTDVDGCIKRINRAAEEMCGWKEEEIAGKQIWDLLGVRSDEIRAFMDSVHNELEPGKPMICRWPDRVSITAKEGENIDISVGVDLVRADDKRLSEMIFVFTR